MMTLSSASSKPSIVPFSKTFLEASYQWLNDPEITQLIMTEPATKKDQEVFFKSLSKRQGYYIFGIQSGSTPIGACGLKNINNHQGEFWGYIGEKSFWGQGIGQFILTCMLKYGDELGLKKLWLKVHKSNYRAIQFYKKNSFVITNTTDSVLVMERPIDLCH